MKKHEIVRQLKGDANFPKFDDAPIRKIFGDETPRISVSQVGRLRLVSALSKKYGETYRNYPDAKEALDHFDAEYAHTKTYIRLKGASRG